MRNFFFSQSAPKYKHIFYKKNFFFIKKSITFFYNRKKFKKLKKIFCNKKSKKIFYNNLGIRRMIICFTVSLMI